LDDKILVVILYSSRSGDRIQNLIERIFMKSVLFATLIVSVGLAAVAAQPVKDLSEKQAQALVIQRAHKYIEENAPDFGGNVNSPCLEERSVNALKVTCTGLANETIGGGGSVKIKFECTGQFTSGIAPSYSLVGRVTCKDLE
jgi:hypothetical protein